MEYVTGTGLVITDRRHDRAAGEFPQIEPREHDPNGNPPSTVGPESRPGEVMGAEAVVFPTPVPGSGPRAFHADAWDGWPPGWETPYMTDGGGGNPLDSIVSRVSTAMTCVDLNSRQIASFPIYGLKGVIPVRLPDWRETPEPELYGSWSEFMHSVMNALLIRGEAFQYVTARNGDGSIARFVNLNPDAVGVEWLDGHIEYLIDGQPIDRNDVIHLKYQSWPGRLRGISPLEWSARALATSAALEGYATKLSTRGGIPWAVLKAQRNLDKDQATDAQNRWVEASMRRDGAPAVLGSGFDLQPLSFSPEQMALLELREFSERRIAAAFGIPGYLVNVSMAQGLTYTNASQLFAHHWTATLRPIARMISEAWSRWLLPAGTIIEFNSDPYVQPPLYDRALSYQAMFNLQDPVTGRRAMEIEEIRAAERMPPSVETVAEAASLEEVQRTMGGRSA